MKPATLVVRSRTYVACLSCGQDVSTIDHLIEEATKHQAKRGWGPWFCDHCGASVQGEVRADGSVLVEPGKRRKEERAVLLAYHATEGADPIYLVVKGMRIWDPAKPESEAEESAHTRYFYEEHTCPVNYLRNTLGVILGPENDLDDDPHGLFAYVGDVPFKGNEDVLGEGSASTTGMGKEVLALFGVGHLASSG